MDREKVIREIKDALSNDLAKAGCMYGLSLNGLKDKALTDVLVLLKEQEVEIRQLKLALDIAKGTCNGIVMEGQ